MKKKIFAMLTALLCVSATMTSVSAYAMPGDLEDCTLVDKIRVGDNWVDPVQYEIDNMQKIKEFIASNVEMVDDVHYLDYESQAMPLQRLSSVQVPVIVTDGTIPSAGIVDGAFAMISLDDLEGQDWWVCEKGRNLENAYMICSYCNVPLFENDAELTELVEKYDFIKEAYWATSNCYDSVATSGVIRMILPADVVPSYETLPELAVFGDEGYFVKVAANDEKIVWDFDGNTTTCEILQETDEAFSGWAMCNPTESYYFMEDILNQLYENHPGIEAYADFINILDSYYLHGIKRIMALTPVVTSSATSVNTVMAKSSNIQPGDVNSDSQADILDVIIINKAVLGKETLTEEQNQAADLNKNNRVDSDDALLLMKTIVGLS